MTATQDEIEMLEERVERLEYLAMNLINVLLGSGVIIAEGQGMTQVLAHHEEIKQEIGP